MKRQPETAINAARASIAKALAAIDKAAHKSDGVPYDLRIDAARFELAGILNAALQNLNKE